MIDTQRLGALLRALIRDDVLAARVRTPPASPVSATSVVGPELPPPDPQAAHDTAPPPAAASATRAAGGAQAPRVPVGPRGEPDAPPLPSAVLRLADRAPVVEDGVATTTARQEASGQRGAPAAANAARPALAALPATPSAELELSDTGRVLLSALRGDAFVDGPARVPGSAMQPVLRSTGAADDASVPAPSARARPLVAVPPHSEFATDRLALQLKDSVEFSGVFYESHLAQWADDMRPRALLAHEPQSRWPVAADIAQQAGMPSAPADYATPVLRQQLEVLDSGRFVWTGELWPGQRASLVIEEDDAPAERSAQDALHASRWRMRIALELPELGAIDATLSLAGETLDLALRCQAPEVAARLREAAPVLRTAIAERALELAHVSIADGQA
jgi:hypothetical protein